jgi:hypothetical protein
MAYNIRRRRVAYDNISAGNPVGKERVIAGNGGTTEAVKERIKSLTTLPTTDIYERIVSASTSATGTTAYIAERFTSHA